MFTEFAGIQFTRSELGQLHSALVMQAMMDDAIRIERGLPGLEQRPMLERIEAVLMMNEEELHLKDHAIDDTLWEYAWYMFTDEWALFRARQDVLKQFPSATGKIFEEKIETYYRQKFESYVLELDMRERENRRTPAKRKKSKSTR